MRKQRSALVETNKAGFKTSSAAQARSTKRYWRFGICFAFDVKTNKISALLAMTAGKRGIWMAAGAGCDAQGHLYVLSR